MAWRPRDSASTSAIGLSIAAALFAIAFTTANLMVAKPGGSDPGSVGLDNSASLALDVIIGQAGRSTTGGKWATAPDTLQRFGLANDAQPNFLDYVKIKALRNATFSSTPNNAPDYMDVRASLGITEGDFHLRTYPVIPDLDDPRWTKDPRGRIAYIGHVATAQGYATMAAWANSTAGGAKVRVEVAIMNTGTSDHIFVLTMGPGNAAADNIIKSEQRHTRFLAPGEVQTVAMELPKMSWSPALTGVELELSDAYGQVIIPSSWLALAAPSSGSNQDWAPLVAAGKTYYEVGEKPTFLADHYEGDGSRKSNDQTGIFVLVGPSGTEIVNATVTLPKNKPYQYECSTCTTAGTYTARLYTASLDQRATDVVHVADGELFTATESLAAIANNEVAIVQSLVTGFNGALFDEDTNPSGDVFTDGQHIRDLDDKLSRYTMLIVGSEVRQNALNAAETKWAIADWVQAGGNLIALGTLDAQSNWLEPVYHAAQETANGGISAPDPTHPVLKTPNELDYHRYLDNARAWRIDDDAPFTHILTRGAGGGSTDDTLAVSEPGAYNEGSVVLTSYMAGALTSPQDPKEAERFLHNLMSQSYNMLFLDYGPPVPSGVSVGSAQRLVAVPHPNVPGAVVEVRIVMYSWK